MIRKISKNEIRERIHMRIRKKLRGTTERPRLAIFRSVAHIYAQVIDDSKGVTLVAASSTEKARWRTAPAATWRRRRKSARRVAERAKENGHQQSGVRSWRLSVSWPREGARRCGA